MAPSRGRWLPHGQRAGVQINGLRNSMHTQRSDSSPRDPTGRTTTRCAPRVSHGFARTARRTAPHNKHVSNGRRGGRRAAHAGCRFSGRRPRPARGGNRLGDRGLPDRGAQRQLGRPEGPTGGRRDGGAGSIPRAEGGDRLRRRIGAAGGRPSSALGCSRQAASHHRLASLPSSPSPPSCRCCPWTRSCRRIRGCAAARSARRRPCTSSLPRPRGSRAPSPTAR